MSTDGYTQTYMPATLDGLNTIDADQIYINGEEIKLDNYVPYDGATKMVDLGNQKIRSTWIANSPYDLINKNLLDTTVSNLTIAISGTFLDKLTSTQQNVVAFCNLTGGLGSTTIGMSNGLQWYKNSAFQHPWTITRRIGTGSILKDMAFRDEENGVDTLLLSEDGQKVFVALTCDYTTASKIPIFDSSKKLVSSGVDSSKIIYLDNCSEDIQTALNNRLKLDGSNANQNIVLGGYKIQSTATVTVNSDYTTKLYVDNAISGAGSLYLLLSGGTMTGSIVMNSNKITTSYTPVNPEDLTRKGYVDSQDALKADITYVNTQLALKANLVGPNTFSNTHTFTSPVPINLSGLTASRVLQLDGSGNVQSSTVSTTTLGYLDVSSSVQNQLNSKLNLTGGTLSGDLTINGTTTSVGSRFLGTPDSSPIGNFWMGLRGTGTEVQRLAIAINGNQTTGVVDFINIPKTVNMSSLTASRVVQLDASKNLTTSSITTNELLALSGISGIIQTQLDNKLNDTGDTITGTLGFSGTNVAEFGIGLSKQVDAGKIGYNWVAGAGLELCGGGTVAGQRAVVVYEKLGVGQAPSAGRFQVGFSGGEDYATFNNTNYAVGEYINQRFLFGSLSGTNRSAYIQATLLASNQTDLLFYVDSGTGSVSERMRIKGDGNVNIAAQVNIGLASNTTPNIKFANSLNHISNSASEAWLFSGYNGHIAIGRNATRNATTANLMMGVESTEESQIISIKTDNSGYMPLTFASSRYVFVGGNIGIGTTSPSTSLHVYNATGGVIGDFQVGNTNANYFDIRTNGTAGRMFIGMDNSIGGGLFGGNSAYMGWVGMPNSANLGFATNNTERMRILTNGNVGIRTTAPAYTLDVLGEIRAIGSTVGGPSRITSENTNAGDAYAVFNCRANTGGGSYWFQNSSTRAVDGGANCATLRNDVGSLRLQSSGAQGITIQATDGVCFHSAGDGSYMRYGPNASWGSYLHVGATSNKVSSTDTGQLILTNGNVHIDASYDHDIYLGLYPALAGRVGTNRFYGDTRCINRFTVGDGASQTLMTVGGGSNGTLPNLFGNIANWPNNANGCLYTQTLPSGANSAGLFVGYNSIGQTGYITSLAPNVAWCFIQIWAAETYIYYYGALSAYTQGGGWVNVSDEREKEDIQPLKTEKSLERVMALKPKHYRRKFNENSANPIPEAEKQKRHVGFIAQEVQQSNPHCISSWCNNEVKEDEETEDDGSRLGMMYNDITVHLVGAVQEQQKQIETLIQRNQILEQHARALEIELKDYKTQTEERFNKLATLIASLK